MEDTVAERVRAVGDDHHVEDIVAERVLVVGVGTVSDEVVVDVLVAETRRERQRVLAVIRVTYSARLRSRAWIQIAAATLSGNSVHIYRSSVHQTAKFVAALLGGLRDARVTAGLAESNGSLPPGS